MFDLIEIYSDIASYTKTDEIVWDEPPPSVEELLDNAGEKFTEVQGEAIDEFYGSDPKKVFDNGMNYLFLAMGKGSGKDFIAVRLVAWGMAILFCMHDPRRHFNISGDATIDIINVSKTTDQGGDIFYKRLVSYVKTNRWFKDRFTIVDGGKTINRGGRAKLIITESTKKLEIPSKGILAISANARYANYEGYSPIMAVIDELGNYYRAPEGKKSPQDGIMVFDTLVTSAKTRYVDKFKIIAISWIRDADDCMMELASQFKGQDNAVVRFHPVWKVRPDLYSGKMFRFTYKGRVFILPVEFKEDMRRSPEIKLRMFGSYILRGGDSFLVDEELFTDFFSGKSICKAEMYIDNNRVKLKPLSWNINYRNYPIFVHVDLGQSNCWAVLTVAYGVLMNKDTDDREVRVIGSFAWIPDESAQVSINDVYAFILELNERYDIKCVQYDKWESVSSIERLEDIGIMAQSHNISRMDYLIMRNMMMAGRLKSCEVDYDLVDQFKSLRDDGKRIETKKGHYKDGTDTYAGVTWLVKNAYRYELMNKDLGKRRLQSRQLKRKRGMDEELSNKFGM